MGWNVAETILICLLVLGVVEFLFPANKRNYYGCGCCWTTRNGAMGRDLDRTIKCPTCGPKFERLLND